MLNLKTFKEHFSYSSLMKHLHLFLFYIFMIHAYSTFLSNKFIERVLKGYESNVDESLKSWEKNDDSLLLVKFKITMKSVSFRGVLSFENLRSRQKWSLICWKTQFIISTKRKVRWINIISNKLWLSSFSPWSFNWINGQY